MTDQPLPKAVHEETIEVLGEKIRVVVLDDGRRIINAEDFARISKNLLGFEVRPPVGL